MICVQDTDDSQVFTQGLQETPGVARQIGERKIIYNARRRMQHTTEYVRLSRTGELYTGAGNREQPFTCRNSM